MIFNIHSHARLSLHYSLPFIYGLFKDAVSNSDYIALNDRISSE
jgi:hypothetical protein